MAVKGRKSDSYGAEEIREDVRSGIEAAKSRLHVAGMRIESVRARDYTAFERMLCGVLDVVAWHVDTKGNKTRWNRRALPLVVEAAAAGFIARKRYKEPAMTPDEVADHMRAFARLLNSVTHP